MASVADIAGAIPGISPDILQQIQGYLQLMQPTEDEKRQARAMGLLGFGLSLAGARRGQELPAIGNSGLLGMQAYRNELSDLTKQRGGNVTQAMQLAGLARQLQTLQAQDEWNKKWSQAWMNSQQTQPGAPQVFQPTTGGAAGLFGAATGAAPATPATLPTQVPTQNALSARQTLADLNIGRVGAGLPDMSGAIKTRYPDIQSLRQGGGYMDSNGNYVPLPEAPKGYVYDPTQRTFVKIAGGPEAFASTQATEQAVKQAYTPAPATVNPATGQETFTPGSMLTQMFGSNPLPFGPVAPYKGPQTFYHGSVTPADVTPQLAAAGNAPMPAAPATPAASTAAIVGGAPAGNAPPGTLVTKASPAVIASAEEAARTPYINARTGYAAQVANSQNAYEDLRKGFMSSRDLASHVANLRQLDQHGVFSGPFQAWVGDFAKWANSAFPDADISTQRLANSQTFVSEMGKMQQAIARTFPGQQSDRELAALTASLPTLVQTPEGRAQIYETLDRKVKDAQTMYRSASDYYKTNNGNLVGWEPPQFTPPPANYGAAPKPTGPLQKNTTATYKAQQAIKAGADPAAVRQRLIDQGYDPGGL